jgi:TolB-like protein
MKQIAEKLGVGYVVEGSVRNGGDRVRITAQLNDVASRGIAYRKKGDLGHAIADYDRAIRKMPTPTTTAAGQE